MLPTISENPSRRVFLSHSSKDAAAAAEIRQSLARRGVDVWSSQDIQPGDNIPASIQQGINDADDVLILISPSSEESPWVEYEAAAALAARESGEGKRIIPVLLDSQAKPPPILSRFNYLDLTSPDRWPKELDRLATVELEKGRMTIEEEELLERQRLAAQEHALHHLRVEHADRAFHREVYLRLALGLSLIVSLFIFVLSVVLAGLGGLSGPPAALLGVAIGTLATLVSRAWVVGRSGDQR